MQSPHAWHVTPTKNLKSIMKYGFQANVSEPEGDLAISIFKTYEDAIRETKDWLQEKFVNQELSILTVNINGIALTETFPFEWIATQTDKIESERIEKVEKFVTIKKSKIMNNIILIGMPAVGKSTIGKQLSKAMQFSFIDTDKSIEKEIKMPLHQFISSEGITKFKEVENRLIKNLVVRQHVISTGGSVIYYSECMKNLQDLGLIVYLTNDFSVIEKRILSAKDRGLVMAPNETLFDLYQNRKPLYEKYANVTIDCFGKNTQQVVGEIIKL